MADANERDLERKAFGGDWRDRLALQDARCRRGKHHMAWVPDDDPELKGWLFWSCYACGHVPPKPPSEHLTVAEVAALVGTDDLGVLELVDQGAFGFEADGVLRSDVEAFMTLRSSGRG